MSAAFVRSTNVLANHLSRYAPFSGQLGYQAVWKATSTIASKNQTLQRQLAYQTARSINSTSIRMSFSNTDTGSKPEDPYKEKNKQDDVSLKQKVDDLIEFMDSTKFAMMTTRIASTGDLVSRAMGLAAKESGGLDLIFHTNTESGKTDDLASDAHINIAFLDSSGQWASISGESAIITDRDVVKKYYSSQLKAWVGNLGDGVHDGGPDDPRIGVIRVKAKTIQYAINQKSAVSRGLEVTKGMVTGNTAQVNSLREITPAEIEKWRSANN